MNVDDIMGMGIRFALEGIGYDVELAGRNTEQEEVKEVSLTLLEVEPSVPARALTRMMIRSHYPYKVKAHWLRDRDRFIFRVWPA